MRVIAKQDLKTKVKELTKCEWTVLKEDQLNQASLNTVLHI